MQEGTTDGRALQAAARLARDERGQGLVEFALILPVLLLILVGIIEFGSVYSKIISMRQGVREAGRQGSVANFGTAPPAGCPVPFSTGSPDIHRLICLAKDQAGVGSSVRVKVTFANANLSTYTDDPTAYQAGNAIVICAIYPLKSLTGLIQPFLGPHAAKTKAAFRIEKVAAGGEIPGGEPPPSGQSWGFCAP